MAPSSSSRCVPASQAYVYRQLDQGYIRIIKLKPAPSKQLELNCELLHCVLEEVENFEAISYVWGNPVFTEDLLLSDGLIKITASLSEALRQFRAIDEERLLWADAVCINQLNDEEKGTQVSMMSTIYNRATRVLAFTGPALEKPVCFTFKALATRARDFGIKGNECDMAGLKGPSLQNVPPFNQSTFAQDTMTEPFRNLKNLWDEMHQHNAIFYQVASRRWFTRLWIVQEVVVSKRTTLFYGNEELEWEDLATVTALAVAMSRYRKDDLTQLLQRSWNIVSLRNEFKLTSHPLLFFKSPFQQFGSSLLRSCWHECGDERDRIYALASLCPKHSPIMVKPDYAKCVEQVYTDLAAQYLEAGDIGIIYEAGLSLRSSPILAGEGDVATYLPSWVPEYRPSKMHRCLPPWDVNEFSSCSSFKKPKMQVFRGPAVVITLSAHTVDFLSLSIFFEDSQQCLMNLKNPHARVETIPSSKPPGLWRLLEAIRMIALSFFPSGKYITGEDIRAAIVRTVLADAADQSVVKLLDFGFDGANEEQLIRLWELHNKKWESNQNLANLKRLENMMRMRNQPGDREDFEADVKESFAALCFERAVEHVLERTQFFFTTRGYMGLASGLAREDDLILQIEGMRVPYLARDVDGQKGLLMLVGQCFVHGIMYGENSAELSPETHAFFLELF